MFTLSQARAEVRAKSAAEFASWRREVVRSRGVCLSGFGPVEAPQALTRTEIDAQARKLVARRNAILASPAHRFLDCVVGVQRAAVAQGRFDLADACEVARSCYSRGLDSNTAPALAALADMEALGADVTKARAALADVAQDEAA